MTDSELIKALENSINTYNQKGIYVDTENLQQQVLDLINRQKVEIERLQKEVNLVSALFQDLQERTDEIKAEAYKEFAERLKSYLLLNKKGEMSVISFENVDSLLKELVGDNK